MRNGDTKRMIEPLAFVVYYSEMVTLCANGRHEARVAYLWRGEWRCLPCLRRAMRLAGATALDVYRCLMSIVETGTDFKPEAVRRSRGVERITPTTGRVDLASNAERNRRLTSPEGDQGWQL